MSIPTLGQRIHAELAELNSHQRAAAVLFEVTQRVGLCLSHAEVNALLMAEIVTSMTEAATIALRELGVEQADLSAGISIGIRHANTIYYTAAEANAATRQ